MKGANLIVKNLQKAGVKVVGGASKAALKLAPLVTVMSLYSDLEKIPGIGTVLKFTRNAQQWVVDNTLGRIPVVGWGLDWASDKLESAFGVSHPDTRTEKKLPWDNNNNENPGNEAQDNTSENDADWYGQLDIPVNINRAMGFPYTRDFTAYATLGGILKLNQIVVRLPIFKDSPRFNNNISDLYEYMTLNLKRNLTYTMPQVKCFILNNMTLYIMAKLLERRMGYLKFRDEEFPEFHDLWQRKFKITQSYNLYSLDYDPNYTVLDKEDYPTSIETYKDLCDTIYQCVLPKHMKAWIDHYFGTVFILDDDVKNKKYSFMVPETVPFYSINNKGDIVRTDYVSDEITPEFLYQLCDSYFHNGLSTLMRTDILKLNNLKETIQTCDVVAGWLTPIDQYNPVPKTSATYKQLILNGYTSDTTKSWSNYIRLDTTTPGLQDVATTFLGLGAFKDENNVFKVRGMQIVNSSFIFFASMDAPVTLPSSFVQQEITSGVSDITITIPTQIVYMTDVDADVYVKETQQSTGGSDVNVYYPNEEFPVNTPTAKELNITFTSSPNLVTATRNMVNAYKVALRWRGAWNNGGDYRLMIPLLQRSSGVWTFVSTKFNINATLDAAYAIGNTADFSTYFEVVYVDRTNTYSGSCGAYHGNVGDVLDALGQIDTTCYILPADFVTAATVSLSITNSNADMYVEVHSRPFIDDPSMDLNIIVAQGSNIKWLYEATYTPAISLPWYSSADIVYPSSSLTGEWAVTDGIVTTTQVSIISGFLDVVDYLFMAAGYSIPVRPSIRITSPKPDGSGDYVFEYAKHLLKEDYIPYMLPIGELPALWNDMFATLTKFTSK